MTIFSNKSYLSRNRFAPRQIETPPKPNLGLVVVIPSYCEPDLLETLNSLEACEAPQQAVEIIVVFNSSKKDEDSIKSENRALLKAAESWNQNRRFSYYFLHFPELPSKHAGVGLARKIGMDEAVDRLEQADRPEGVIICLDADSQVNTDYLVEIEKAFLSKPRATACSLHFEHPLRGNTYSAAVYEGILRYELYLRYYIEGLRFAGYPYAYHTIGSSMAVRSSAYQAEGGMNRRKAGEDFYFLHKFIPNPGFFELNATTVIPSPRPAQKVPFGTGKAITNWLNSGAAHYPAYDFRSFEALKELIDDVENLYIQAPQAYSQVLQRFLDQEGFLSKIAEIREHVASQQSFEKRFFQWMNPLKVLQFVHFARDHAWPEIEILEASAQLWQAWEQEPLATREAYLMALRERQKSDSL